MPKTAMEYADRDRTRCSEGPHHVEKGTSHLIVVLQVQSLTRSIPWYMSIVSGKQHDRIGLCVRWHACSGGAEIHDTTAPAGIYDPWN